MDKLINCLMCGGENTLYINKINKDIEVYSCFNCGFMTNSLMKEGETFFNEQIDILPNLYKDIMKTDQEGRIWIPSYVYVEEKGVVFVNGTNVIDWEWVGIKHKMIPEEERKNFPIPGSDGNFYKYKSDSSTLKNFGQDGFFKAVQYIGVIDNLL
jgi:hypothetical protein